MKLVTAVIFLLLKKFYCATSLEPQGDVAIGCSSSGKSCTRPYCYLERNGPPDNDLISFGCHLQRRLPSVFVRFLDHS